jgi:transposase
MMPTVAELPDDIDTLKAMVLATVEQRATMEAENSRIASEIAALKLINTTSDARIAELTAIVKTFERMLYGTRSERLRGERLDDEQIDFVFDEIETGVAAIDAELETGAKDKPKRAPRPRKGFAPHLERIEQVIEPEVPPGCEDLEKVLIGEDVSERLDVTAAKFRVIVTRRPKYAYRGRDGVIQAPAPPHIIESGIPTEALLAQIAVAKYADGLPLYRQEAIYARDKTELSRSLMAQWMGKVGFELQPLADYVLRAHQAGRKGVRRRNHVADAGAGKRQDPKGLVMGLRARRQALRAHQSADGRLSLRGQPQRRLRGASSGGLHRHSAGGWLRRLHTAGQSESRLQ